MQSYAINVSVNTEEIWEQEENTVHDFFVLLPRKVVMPDAKAAQCQWFMEVYNIKHILQDFSSIFCPDVILILL